MSKLEYLNPSDWSLHVIDGENEGVPKGWVLVPEGKNVAYKCNVDNVIYFTKLEMGYRDFDLVWKRNQSLNDKRKGIEAYISIDKSTLKDIKARADIFCEKTSKHNHYFKNVENLNMIDVYRVLELFDVQSHAVGHAVKKLLCSGGRGSKDYLQDIQEAIDSLQREIEMKKEDSK